MLAVAFDTLKLARKLESAGMPPKQAQETSSALSDTFTEWLSVGSIATHDDVLQLAKSMREDVQRLAGSTREDMQRLETRIGNLELKTAETKAEILKWMFGAVGTQTIVLLVALYGPIHTSSKF